MTPHHESQDFPPQAVNRLGLYLPTALLLTGALAWSGFWFYSAQLAETHIAAHKANEAAKGRTWECADQKIAGFPFRIELHCASVTLTATPDGRPARLRTGPLHAATQIYSPNLVLADVDGPLVVESDGATTQASWDNLRISVRFSNRLDRLSLVMANLKADHQTASGEKFASAAKALEAHLRYDPARPPDERAMDISFQVNELSSPTTDALFGSSEKLTLAVAGAATKLADVAPQGWRNTLETWRNEGGKFFIENGALSKGAMQIETKGALDLDASRRLQGKLDVSAKGIAPLVSRVAGNGVSQMIGPLITRKDGSPVQWPLLLQDGRLQIGPFRTGAVLSPLY